MAFSGALNASAPTCLCNHRAPSIRSPLPALTGRSGLAGLERRRTGATIVRRPSIQTYVAAVEESPAAEAAPSSSGEDKEFEYAIDFTNTDDLYKRFNELLERSSMEIKLGDRVTGTVASVDQRGAYVDFGGKQPLFCPLAEVSLCKLSKATQALQVDQVREFQVNYQDRRTGELRLSIKTLEKALLWQRLRQMSEEGAPVEAVVDSVRPAGLIVRLESSDITGFVPGSHIMQAPGPSIDWNTLLGEKMNLKILELDEEKDRLVLSNRKNTFATKKQMNLQVGEVVEGTVATLQPYGAFVTLGDDNVNGLLHISQISHDRISSVEQVLKVGQKVKVMILTMDKEKGRVSLSTKKLEPTPGDMVRDPELVFARADEMAAAFRERYLQAEAEARGDGGAPRQAAPKE
ncbi:30S ribosomal protein S1, chloroplastic [Coccomyxa sp. Obi]|nr:30S ribosomal protein S1, chloroplastic [Coccomyxa sp. Obi]